MKNNLNKIIGNQQFPKYKILKLIKSNGYETIEDMMNDNKKISWESDIIKIGDCYKCIMTPYLEDIIKKYE